MEIRIVAISPYLPSLFSNFVIFAKVVCYYNNTRFIEHVDYTFNNALRKFND